MTSLEIFNLISITLGTTFWGWFIIWEVEQRQKEAAAKSKENEMFGKLFAAPVRLLNVPFRAIEKIVDDGDPKEDRILSGPLEAVAESVEEAIDGEEE